MNIEIPDDRVEEILRSLQATKRCRGAQYVARLIEKELKDTAEVEYALSIGDCVSLRQLLDVVNPGFNRFRILLYLKEHEEEHGKSAN